MNPDLTYAFDRLTYAVLSVAVLMLANINVILALLASIAVFLGLIYAIYDYRKKTKVNMNGNANTITRQ